MKSIAIITEPLQERPSNRMKKVMATAISKAIKNGYGRLLALADDALAIRAAVAMVEMVEDGEIVLYHPSKRHAIVSEALGVDGKIVYVIDSTEELPDYVRKTKPETEQSFTLETVIALADAVIVVDDGGATGYPLHLSVASGKPVYWINPAKVQVPGTDKYREPGEGEMARWIMPDNKMDKNSERVIGEWKNSQRRRYGG